MNSFFIDTDPCTLTEHKIYRLDRQLTVRTLTVQTHLPDNYAEVQVIFSYVSLETKRCKSPLTVQA